MATFKTYSGSSTTWETWAIEGTASTASTANTWTAWTSGTSGTSNVSDGVWCNWITLYVSSGETYKQPTAAELEQRRIESERRQSEYRAQEEKRKADEAKAEATAQELLEHFLTPEQRETMEKISAITVKSQSDKTYLVKKHGRVQELNDAGKVIAEYCIVPNAHLPPQDSMLIKKLMLETNEAAFLKTANRTPIQ